MSFPLLLKTTLRCVLGVATLSALVASLSAQSVPTTDPTIDPANYAPFNDALLGEHPRLLFTEAELAQLQIDVTAEPLFTHYNKLLGYLGASQVPSSSNFRYDATEAQRQGLWRMPTVAMHYALTGNTTSRDRTVAYMEWLNGYTDWENGGEKNSGMAAANMMVGAAICYDIMHDYLSVADPSFLEEFRQKIFYHARAMYHLGHLGGQGGYWQVDPQNNHRWHRNAGLALCMLAAYEGNPEEEWMLREVFNELAFVAEYLPDDGTSHESPSYMVFGGAHLTLALEAADNCFGTSYLDIPFYQNAARFHVNNFAPGFRHFFMYGDGGDSLGGYGQYNMISAARHGEDDLLAAIDHLNSVNYGSYEFGWMGIIWRGTSQPGGDYHDLPLVQHFEDLGLTYMREGWDKGDAAAMFMCAVLGGYRLNDYRNDVINGGYINVAHDDPNANSFVLFKDDEWVAETDRYSYNKRSSNHNTILVDGVGQRPQGRNEGLQYSQPGTGGQDMTTLAHITWEEDNGDVVITEGEAQGWYRGALSRYRRSFIWKTGDYVLVLDDIRANQDREIDWLIQSGSVTTRSEPNLEFTLVKGNVSCQFDVDATESLSVAKVTSTADNRNTVLGFQQLQLTAAATQNLQIASVYDLWDHGSLTVNISNQTATGATISVTGNGVNDTWAWTFAPDNETPSTIALEQAPTVHEEPAGDPVGVNESAILTVGRGGLGPAIYQWYQGNVGDTSTPVGGDSPTLTTGPLSAPTTYWVRITTAYGTADSAAFQVDLTSGFLLWVENEIASGPTSEGGDADHDGLANLLEYALGMSPAQSENRRPSISTSSNMITLDFEVPASPLMDVLYEIQVSTSLTGDWSTVLAKSAGGEWTGDANYAEGPPTDGRVPVSVDLTPGQFIRLKVTRI
ncbi:heparinase II/III domain-containing protein [Cerasicoccus fimbriatus]|uniref:heparinase II/III domain-containing protein n=1 Tax=Cerasicoccus fimbriatus TaxID=3014554 RepID=UPI0022B4ECD1|nr:heparinase II/III family protein [Cerasicoccus sp. TK19100]